MLALFLPVGFLVLASLVMLSSIATHFFLLQLVWACVGVGVVVGLWLIDWRAVLHFRWLVIGFYVFVLFLLLVVATTGPIIRNTRSWLVFGPLNFQPVELAKIALILVYAQYFSRKHLIIARLSHIGISFLYFVIPAIFVLLQPDLGSTIVLFSIWVGFLLVSGLPSRYLAVGFFIFLIAGTFLWFFGLKTYQRERVIGVFYPERDVLGVNYSVHQAKIAIGSAGFFGKGYKQGPETQLGFLTEPAGDFILAALIEEWGWAAGMLVIAAFLAMVVQILRIGASADRNFEKFICLGAAIMFGTQFFLNAGSVTGISPVIGVTFPFLSYGGSSLLTNFCLLAIINAIAYRS